MALGIPLNVGLLSTQQKVFTIGTRTPGAYYLINYTSKIRCLYLLQKYSSLEYETKMYAVIQTNKNVYNYMDTIFYNTIFLMVSKYVKIIILSNVNNFKNLEQLKLKIQHVYDK